MARTLATEKGKKFAQTALRNRRVENSKKAKINNADLPAGSSMYFYCKSCGGEADVLSESYIAPPRQLCNECQALQDLGWLE